MNFKAAAMKTCRIHVMGASGAGVTSLGRALADALAIPHHDTDDYFLIIFGNPPRRPIATNEKLPSAFG